MTGMQLKLKRIRLRVRQIEVSRASGIATSRLSLIENGYVKPRADELMAICAALGTKDAGGAKAAGAS